MHFHYMTVKFTILVDHSLVIITAYLVYLIYALEKGRKKMHFHTIWLFSPRPSTRTLAPGVMKYKDFGRPFLAYHYYILSLFNLCLGVEKKFFKKYNNFIPKLPPLWVWGHEIYNFLSPTLHMLHTKFD